tara:strand:+ start:1000 stop:1395 length:396 start_codon:yes stop_codon:yes gene_type:complete
MLMDYELTINYPTCSILTQNKLFLNTLELCSSEIYEYYDIDTKLFINRLVFEDLNKVLSFVKLIKNNFKYKKIKIESIYDLEKNILLYTNNYIEKNMDENQKKLVYHRRNSRSYSETDFLTLKEIIKIISK